MCVFSALFVSPGKQEGEQATQPVSATRDSLLNLNFTSFQVSDPKILSLKHISKPSKNIYFSSQDLWIFDRSLGLIILNTSHGIMSHKTALSKNLGGQALCYIF
ncbi:ribosomal protein S8 [Tribonema minus]|uniref:Ribosomal protein S8 n=1 Tax=Tribonema minus TaxID=303371 RepID=A0A835YXN5_9STRA|nr:ribosomal protein S8 [Tribonema minus]